MIDNNLDIIIDRLTKETEMPQEVVKELYLATGKEEFVISGCKAIKASGGTVTTEMLIQVFNHNVEIERQKIMSQINKQKYISIGRQKEQNRSNFTNFVRKTNRKR